MKNLQRPSIALLFLLALCPHAISADAEFYAKHDTWAETLLDGRERCAAWWNSQPAGVTAGPWHMLAARETGRDIFQTEKTAPPANLDLAARNRKGERRWEARPDLLDGVVHCDLSNHGIDTQRVLPKYRKDLSAKPKIKELLPPAKQTTAPGPPFLYQARVIRAERAQTVTAWLGAQNGLEGWLNGEKIFSEPNLGNGLFPRADLGTVELRLEAGENFFALRLLGDRWDGFYFSLLPRARVLADPLPEFLERLERDFPAATYQMRADLPHDQIVSWFRGAGDAKFLNVLLDDAAQGLGGNNKPLRAELEKRELETRRRLALYERAALIRRARSELETIDCAALRRAIRDLAKTYPEQYPRGQEFLSRVQIIERRLPTIHNVLDGEVKLAALLAAAAEVGEFKAFQRLALLSNPLLDFDDLLLIKRATLGDPRRAKAPNRGMGEFLGLPQQSSWQLDRIRQPYGWDNEIALLKMPAPESGAAKTGKLKTVYRPPVPKLISDVDLHYDADKILLSMPGSNYLWQVFELDLPGDRARQLTPEDPPDVHHFDACYLPNGKLVFISTAPFQGVPCSNGIVVAVAYVMDGDGRNIRQLCFDQDHDYAPNVMNDGRVLYLRWDYTDLPHQWPRILFTMNPDGSGQREFYGSGSYWPNAIFYARPVPNHPTKIAGIVTGHHVGRVGELVIFDPAKGRHEAGGVVQRIPGHGQPVEPIVIDKLTIDSWPKFVQPFPLSDKYLLVSGKPRPGDLWGIYLVDVFDNILLLEEVEGYGLFEPIPLRKTKRPPVIPETTDPARDDALMYVENIYEGPGLKGVPHGAVKQLRLFTYHFAYQYKSGGQHRVGADGPWEPKRVLGTVPVEADGSAFFRVPAKTPISLQPLDAEGQALQLMRSWTTAMPGEFVSCTGCHEKQNAAPANRGAVAARREPSEITPWHGPVRGFSFAREVQPVLDRYCVGCHDGAERAGETLIDLRGGRDDWMVIKSNDPTPFLVRDTPKSELVKKYSGVFEPSYLALRRLVRTGGLESDLHQLHPGEFHANTSELFQMLRKGHHGVRLDREAWERLAIWVDLNAPCHGAWNEIIGREQTHPDYARRRELRQRYASLDLDYEAIAKILPQKINPIVPVVNKIPQSPSDAKRRRNPQLQGWPLDAATAKRKQAAAGPVERSIDLGDGLVLELVRVPAGAFIMGDAYGELDEQPLSPVTIGKSFWIGKYEVTNEQYARCAPAHDSRFEHGAASAASKRARGPVLNQPRQPVVRVSWQDALAFCQWLSAKTGERFALPTEAQWEYACRAGSATPFYFGDLDADFSPYANLADATIDKLASWSEKRRGANIVPRDARFNDKALVTAEVGRYQPNAWGLHDVHGSVWEWTRSTYSAYPYREDDGRNAAGAALWKTVRGGSWYDRPKRCRSAFRLSYPAWQKVYNVGFRVVLEDAAAPPPKIARR